MASMIFTFFALLVFGFVQYVLRLAHYRLSDMDDSRDGVTYRTLIVVAAALCWTMIVAACGVLGLVYR